MAHKVHPKIFRVRETKDWDSRWFQGKPRVFAMTLREDYIIRTFLTSRLKEASLERVDIERVGGKTIVIIHSARPGLIIGRGGAGVETLRKKMEMLLAKKTLSKEKKEIRVEIREIKNPWESAALTGQFIAQQLEKRMPFRRAMKQAVSKVLANRSVQGVRIDVAGRLGGADIARSESVKEGRLPLQTLRADIDYALTEAITTYGVTGIKVWLYKGEKKETA